MARAISINVKPRARCTTENYSFHRKSQQRRGRHLGVLDHLSQRRSRRTESIYSVARGVTVNGSKGDRLRPPSGMGAITEKGVYQCVVKLARTHQVLAKLFDCLCPIIRPHTSPVVDWGFSSASDSLETQNRQPRRQGTTDLIVDSSLA